MSARFGPVARNGFEISPNPILRFFFAQIKQIITAGKDVFSKCLGGAIEEGFEALLRREKGQPRREKAGRSTAGELDYPVLVGRLTRTLAGIRDLEVLGWTRLSLSGLESAH